MKTINPMWSAEFRGLFAGEGNFMIDLYEREIHNCLTFTARCRCRIIARDDNKKMLLDIQSKLGGHLYTHKTFKSWWRNGKEYTHHANIVWQVQSVPDVEKVLDILEDAAIPNKKSLEIPVMRDAIRVMKSRKHRYTDEMRQELKEIQIRLFSMRQYQYDV